MERADGLIVEGFDRYLNMLKAYGRSLDVNEVRRITRETIKPVLQQAQREVARIEMNSSNDTTGNLWESLGFITGKSREFPNVQIGPRAKRGFKGHHGHLVEFGTSSRKNRKGSNRGKSRPNPFMKPAFEKTKGSIVNSYQNAVAKLTQKIADKTFK